ncbi:quinolinate synthase NadA [Vulgatibacter incomptus]|uniref:Quinolinate synthase n=1 Tax=Vulgatibacter incomptus TaxID=1391653 RepID=A0A0K1PE02_9BACT|nr:quinolinate synthase NadA [Vulgatibacter incomptus]AKU91354.1 Quinolinate synthetase [Vulgatibacter incomptus]
MAIGPDLFDEIEALKKERNAIILAHYYQEPDIQEIADFVGDSLQLAQAAQGTKADVICFAGVHFMAETAKILNPGKTVVIPDLDAGCSLADSCPPDAFAAFKARHPHAKVITYINCSAGIKALSDVIVTSSNAERIVESFPPEQELIFAPDRNLGAWLSEKLGRKMILWDGSCIVHEQFSERKLVQLKVRNPDAEVIAHPECEASVLRHADFVGSTSALLSRVKASDRRSFIVATEPGIFHEMQRAAPEKTLLEAPIHGSCPTTGACNECPHMKRNTLEKVRDSLRDLSPAIDVPEPLRSRALQPILRMLELSRPRAA